MAVCPLICIVDHDDSARRAVVGLVRALGFAAAEFQSGADFLRSDHLPRTACVIADMQMPGMSGLQLHRQLTASGAPIPIILMTSYPDTTTRARALAAGVNGYLTKPCAPNDLLDCIRSAVGHLK
jgi:FixJ family two-component response regulator